MATQISNRATLTYKSGTKDKSTASNTAVITMHGPMEIRKYALEDHYQIGEVITYNVFLSNTGTGVLSDITIADNLGTYEFDGTTDITPLTYIGPAKLFIDSVYSSTLAGTAGPSDSSVSFDIASLSVGSSLLLQYKCMVNEFASADVDHSVITNTVQASATDSPNVSTTCSLPIASYADVVIEKNMSPNPYVDGELLTYTFTISNYGTIEADNIVLTDRFHPAPPNVSVSLDGSPVSTAAYTGTTLTFPVVGTFDLPPATFTQDQDTGVVTITPSSAILTVTGTL